MSRSELYKRYLVLFFGLCGASLGVAVVTLADLGTSPISSVPYVLSLGFAPTLGQFTMVVNLLLIVMQALLLRRQFQAISLLQIPVVIVFGWLIDLAVWVAGPFAPGGLGGSLVWLLAGCAALGFGVWLEVVADVLMLPGDAFVRAVVIVFGPEFGKAKIGFDTTMTLLAAALSLVLFHRLNGVGIGTIIAAFLVGAFARWFGQKLRWVPQKLFPPEDETSSVSAS